MDDEPITDLAHLGHVELLTPKPEESLRFFVEIMGMTESGRRGDNVCLRGWDDYEYYSLQSSPTPTPLAWATPPSARGARRRWSGGSRRCARRGTR